MTSSIGYATGGSATYLATLSDPIAVHLVEMVRVAADTSPEEKHLLVAWIESSVTEMFASLTFREQSTMIQLLAALGQMIGAVGNPVSGAEGTHTPSAPGEQKGVN